MQLPTTSRSEQLAKPQLAALVTLLLFLSSNHHYLLAQTPTAVDAGGDPLPPGARLRIGTLRFSHPKIVCGLALSPDEKTVVTVGEFVIAWDTTTGKERWRAPLAPLGLNNWPAASYGIRLVAFSADGGRFYIPGKHGEFIAWETMTGKQETKQIVDELAFAAPNQVVPFRQPGKAIDVTADGKKFAVGGASGLKVSDDNGKQLFEIETTPTLRDNSDRDRLKFGGDYTIGRFSPDGNTLAVVASDAPQEIQLLDATTGRSMKRISLKDRAVRFVYSPDGKRIAVTERDVAVRLYDVETGEQVWSRVLLLTDPYENYTSDIDFAPDGNTITAGATDHFLYLFDAASGNDLGRLEGHVWYPWTLAFAADSKTLYSSGWDAVIRRWDIEAKKQMDLPAGVRGTDVVAASPDGRTLAYADETGTVRLINAKDGAERQQLKLFGTKYTQLAFSPDGGQLAGGGTLGENVHLAVWNLPAGDLADRFDWPKGKDPHSAVESISFSPDGKRLAAAVFRQDAGYLWDLTTSEQIAKLEHTDIYGLSFRPDGHTLATAGWDSCVRLWDGTSGEADRMVNLKFLAGPQGRATSVVDFSSIDDDWRAYTVCYAPFGPFAATVHINRFVLLWNAVDMSPVRLINKMLGSNHGALSFSPDGLWLAVGSVNGQVSLWDPWSGTEVLAVGKHEERIYTVGFGRDSRTLVSGAGSICYQWDLRPREPLPKKEVHELWIDLAGNNGPAAYAAMWALADTPDAAVKLVAEKIKPAAMELTADAMSDNWRTAQRAVSLLAQIGTLESTRLLREFADQNQNRELSRLAAAALNRVAPRD